MCPRHWRSSYPPFYSMLVESRFSGIKTFSHVVLIASLPWLRMTAALFGKASLSFSNRGDLASVYAGTASLEGLFVCDSSPVWRSA
jgi:hypothetical protein